MDVPIACFSIEPCFDRLIFPDARLERLHTGMLWTEGPVYLPESDSLVWSDIPNNVQWRWSANGIEVFRRPANFSNGNTLDQQGRLITCEHGERRVVRREPDGSVTVIADRYLGRRLNSPNDVVVKSDGSIWFTDPPYGILSDYEGRKADPEYGGCNVFRFDPRDGRLSVVASDFDKPNGLAFSLDERILYVTDTGGSHTPNGAHHIRALQLDDGHRVVASREFAEINPGFPDGLRVDAEGNLWTSAGDGVQCYASDGRLLGKIRVPETVSNVCFGGPGRNRLFITATTSVYVIDVAVKGAV